MSGQLEATRESVEGSARPRNPEVENAWKDYAAAYQAWQRILSSSICTSTGEFARLEEARLVALQAKSATKDEALFEYFETYDRDQRRAFGEES